MLRIFIPSTHANFNYNEGLTVDGNILLDLWIRLMFRVDLVQENCVQHERGGYTGVLWPGVGPRRGKLFASLHGYGDRRWESNREMMAERRRFMQMAMVGANGGIFPDYPDAPDAGDVHAWDGMYRMVMYEV